MNKSIKDYKDAMDSIKISDSFYKRTEILLSESSEMEITKSSSSKIRIVSRAVMASAACLLVAFGIKTVADNRTVSDTTAVTEIIVQETTVVTVPVTIPESASPVIDRPEAEEFIGDSGVLMDDMPAIPEGDLSDSDAGGDVKTNPTASPESSVEEEAGFKTDVEDDVAISMEDDSDDSDKDEFSGSGYVSEEDADTDSDSGFVNKSPEDAEYDDADAGAESEDDVVTEETFTTTSREGYPEMSEPEGAENIPPLGETANDKVMVEITPYFDLSNVKSGENPVIKSGNECSELISSVAVAAETSPQDENIPFTSVFLVQIYEKDTELPYYSIYLTNEKTIVITRHDIDAQRRSTCFVSEADYDKILHILFSEFGKESEYDFFYDYYINTD
ncbi:MAG: hypothetical protein IJZ61_06675 [Oscillospiraceae bacterium]|nr:hypothetical protein [Oscillospiraceae bacterium]